MKAIHSRLQETGDVGLVDVGGVKTTHKEGAQMYG